VCVFLVPIYSDGFPFSSLFIGSNGVYINEIKGQCEQQLCISVQVHQAIMSVTVVGADSPLDFIRGVRLVQDRLVIVYEIFMKEKQNTNNQKRYDNENPRVVFV